MAKPKSKEKVGLRLTVEESKLELSVLFKAEGSSSATSLAKSTAGGSGFAFKTCCATHQASVNAPKVCATCRLEEAERVVEMLREMGASEEALARVVQLASVETLPNERTLKGYDVGGGNYAFLTQEQVAALRPKGDNSVHILCLIEQTEIGSGFRGEVVRLLPGVRALVPNTTSLQPGASAAMGKRWSALLALLEGRVAVARVMHKASFRYCLLQPGSTGALLAIDLYLPEDTYDVPLVSVQPLSSAEREAFVAKGSELARGRRFGIHEVSEDPYREARHMAVAAAARGDTPPPEVEVVTVAPQEESLLALV